MGVDDWLDEERRGDAMLEMTLEGLRRNEEQREVFLPMENQQILTLLCAEVLLLRRVLRRLVEGS